MKQKLLVVSKYLAISLFSLLMLVWLVSPFIAQYAIQKALTPHNLTISGQSSIRYNPFISTISIRKLAITQSGKIVLAINEMDVGISLYQLLFDRIYLKQFDIDGVYAKVSQQQEQLFVAGFDLSAKQQAQSGATSDTSEQTKSYELILPELKLLNSKIEIVKDKHLITLLTPYLNVKNAQLSEQRQTLYASIKNKINQGSLTLNADINLLNGQGSITSSVEAINLDLTLLKPWLPSGLTVDTARLSLDSQQKVTLIGDRKEFNLTKNKVLLEQVALKTPQLALTTDMFDVFSPDLVISMNEADKMTIEGNGQLLSKYLSVANAANEQQQLASIRKIQSHRFNISTPNQKPMVVFDDLAIEKAMFSDDALTPELPLSTIEAINFDEIVVQPDALSINLINITDLVVNTTIDKNKAIANLAPITSIQNQHSQPAKVEEKAAKTSSETMFGIALNQLRLQTPMTINFNDTSISPTYQRKYTIKTLELGPVDSYKPNLETSLIVTGESDHFEKFNLKSTNQLFTKTPQYRFTGQVSEVDLSAISPYINKALKHDIKNGHLDLSFDTGINNNQLSGNADVKLRRVDFMANVDIDDHAVKTTAGMPLNYALGMLKDSNDNVELSIPLSGDISDPKFGVADITALLLKKASMMAAKDYLLKTFVPYANVVSVALSAADHVLKVRFNDLIFQPKQIDAEISNANYLEQFAKLMLDKPDTQVSICPIAVPQDINLPAETTIKDAALKAQLNAISTQRFNAFKKLMTTKYNINSARLLLCSPSIDSKKSAQPRLTFSS